MQKFLLVFSCFDTLMIFVKKIFVLKFVNEKFVLKFVNKNICFEIKI